MNFHSVYNIHNGLWITPPAHVSFWYLKDSNWLRRPEDKQKHFWICIIERKHSNYLNYSEWHRKILVIYSKFLPCCQKKSDFQSCQSLPPCGTSRGPRRRGWPGWWLTGEILLKESNRKIWKWLDMLMCCNSIYWIVCLQEEACREAEGALRENIGRPQPMFAGSLQLKWGFMHQICCIKVPGKNLRWLFYQEFVFKVHGRGLTVSLEPSVALAADAPANMMPWAGDPKVIIDRWETWVNSNYSNYSLNPGSMGEPL